MPEAPVILLLALPPDRAAVLPATRPLRRADSLDAAGPERPGVIVTGDAATAAAARSRWPGVAVLRLLDRGDGEVVPGQLTLAAPFDDAQVAEALATLEQLAAATHAANLATHTLDHVPAFVAYLDRDERYVYTNRKFATIESKLGGPLDGRRVSDVIDSETYARRKPLLRRVLDAGESVSFEATVHLPDDPNAMSLIRYVPDRADDGTVRGIVGFALDITDRVRQEIALRESEARFKHIADAMPQIVWVTRPDGFHEYFNQRWYEYTGVARGATDGEEWIDVLHPDDRERSRARWQRALTSGEPYSIEYRLRSSSGDYRWFLGLALPGRDADGRIARWYGSCTDIHERHELEAERGRVLERETHARAEAERVGRVKDEFLATLSHELRTPLNAILGWAQVLRRSNSMADVQSGLAVIERNARAQAQIIEDLLDMSRIISGKVRLAVQPTDLAGVVRTAVETVRPAADARNIAIVQAIDPLPPIAADAGRLQQVFWNLLSNAVKFTPPGGRVEVAARAAGAGVISVRVADTGEGIDAAFLPFAFDRFRQADGSTTRRHGGLGLGLSIVKQLVELHGGTVTAESPGRGLGTTFEVRLPAGAAGAAPPTEPPPTSI